MHLHGHLPRHIDFSPTKTEQIVKKTIHQIHRNYQNKCKRAQPHFEYLKRIQLLNFVNSVHQNGVSFPTDKR